jgi:beta-mannosidase
VQLDLMELGEVPDPFYRLNEIDMHELEGKEWTYRRTFDVSSDVLDADKVELVFEGLDTYAEVYLNDTFLGQAENMFIAHRFDAGEALRQGENTVEVRFASALDRIKTLEANSPVQLQGGGESARPYVRKAQYAYGWDWGPRIAQIGIWRPAYLEVIRRARLKAPYFYTEALDEGHARVRVEASVDAYADAHDLRARISLSLDGEEAAEAVVPVEPGPQGLALGASLTVEHAHLWWPNGMGGQPLYDVRIELLEGDEPVDTLTFRSGIRTVGLLQQEDAEGTSFVFLINGIKVWAKGANWIPADNMLPRVSDEDYHELIALARQANMNMLRIWGGGIYEDPAFYAACDELGIMVWQDFMYACAQYPDEFDWFQELAREEARAVVTELRNHPSIVLWCGNNENNWGFDEWWNNGVPKYLGNYIYREIQPQVCAELDPSRPYWVSSPYGRGKPNSESDGDRHAWTVWSGWQDYAGYLGDTGRFLSEFGFQAMPDWKTVLWYTAPEDRRILSPVVIGHNKMVNGTERLVRFMVGRLGFPADLQSYVYLTQFNQAEAIKTGVEHWRLRGFMTSGALYWQFNDCWPVASWSCLDWFKRRKALYHYSRHFFAPILPVLVHEKGADAHDRVELYGVNEGQSAVRGEGRITSYALDGTRRAEQRFSVLLGPQDVTHLASYRAEELDIGHSPRVLPVDAGSTTYPREHNAELLDTVVYVELSIGGQSYRNYLVFEKFRYLNLAKPQIEVQVEGREIRLCSDAPAFAVFVETEEDVALDDNCLVLEPGVEYTLTATGDPGQVTVHDLSELVAEI